MKLSPESKIAGVLAPLFALRGENDLGIGDIGALREFIGWAARQGFRVVQLLPVNETGNDNSPYNAISSVALDPGTIEITPQALPDLRDEDASHALSGIDMDTLCRGPVKYGAVKALKRNLLRRAYDRFIAGNWQRNDARSRDFQQFIKDEADWIEGYALYRVLMEQNEAGERWDLWPEGQRTFAEACAWLEGQPAKVREELEREIRFVMYIQWIAFTQWRAIREEADRQGVALMGDVPFGVSYYSADVFADPEIFDHEWSGGAPPEPLFKDDPFTVKWGQNWGVPLYRWNVLQKRNLDWWRQRVGKVREMFHFFRIDHVLGFYRIYAFPWRPQRNGEFLPLTKEEAVKVTGGELPRFHDNDDETPKHRDANCRNGEDRLRPLIEEAGEYRLIGEDLGTVPPYVRPSLERLRISGFKVPQWETRQSDQQLTPGADYLRLSVATHATHDHEPLRAQWDRWMSVIARAEYDSSPAAAQARETAWWEVRRIAGWCKFEVPRIMPFQGKPHQRFLAGLLECNSWMAIFMITDLFGTSQRFNVPGAVADSNWSERLDQPISAWEKDPALAASMKTFSQDLVASGRAGSPAAGV